MTSLFTKKLPPAVRELVTRTAVKIDQVQAGSKPRHQGNAVEMAVRQRRADDGSSDVSQYQALTGASKDYFFNRDLQVKAQGYQNYAAKVNMITSQSRHSDALYTLAQKLKTNALTHLANNNPDAARVYLSELQEIQHNMSHLQDNARAIELDTEVRQLEQRLNNSPGPANMTTVTAS